MQIVDTVIVRQYMGFLIDLFLLSILFIGSYYYLRLMRYRLQGHQSRVMLELTPNAFSNASANATDQLLRVLHDRLSEPWYRRVLYAQRSASLEIHSSRDKGIRYLLILAASQEAVMRKHFAAYSSDLTITARHVSFPVRQHRVNGTVVSFRQTKHYAFPIRQSVGGDVVDPIAFLTSSMTQLASGEEFMFQLVVQPFRSITARRICRHLSIGRYVRIEAGSSFKQISRLIAHVLTVPLNIITELLLRHEGLNSRHQQSVADRLAAQHIYREEVRSKLAQPLFRVAVRCVDISNTSKQESKNRMDGFVSSLVSLAHDSRQLISQIPSWRQLQRQMQYSFINRLPSLSRRGAVILSSTELATIYHFSKPDDQIENVSKKLNRTLVAPITMKQGNQLDIYIGINKHHGQDTLIGLTSREREKHTFIVGGTGNGKTTMLQGSIIQDIQHGKGLAVLDPHGDLAEEVLRHIPPERMHDVIYFNPDDLDYPIGLNLLEVPKGLSGTALLRERDLVTEAIVSVFRKLFSDDDSGGHRVEYVLRNTIQTALTQPHPTLFTVYRLLNDPTYQKTVVRQLTDQNLQNFWWHEMGRAGDYQRVKMAAGVTAKIGRFLFSASAKQILEQPQSTINFDDIMSSGKILICNLSKGLLGEDTSTLFGTTILAKLQIATLRRARIAELDRRPFYLYVDEFQNFATHSFVQMLSEARKFHLFVTIAEQSTSQQAEQRMVQIILANVGTLICFRTANPADEAILLPSFMPFVKPGELSNLPLYSFYARLSAVHVQEPISGETIVPEQPGSMEHMKQVIARSREQYVLARQPAGDEEQDPKIARDDDCDGTPTYIVEQRTTS